MKLIKWGFVIALTVAATCVLLFTFIQEPFSKTAALKIFWYSPGEFPVYLYVAATFALGLLIGFFAAAYYYIAGRAGIHGKKKEIKRLEAVIAEMTGELERLRSSAGQTQKKITETLNAVGEKDFF